MSRHSRTAEAGADWLNPCPKCGKPPQFSFGTRKTRVICRGCGVMTAPSEGAHLAGERWNAGECDERGPELLRLA